MKEKRTRLRRKNAGYKKLLLILIIIFIIMLMLTKVIFPATISLSKYVYSVVRGAYLNSKDFYFTSNMMGKPGKDNLIETSDWDGMSNHNFDIVMYSKKNDFKKATANIKYKINIEATVWKDQGTGKEAVNVGNEVKLSSEDTGNTEDEIMKENEYIKLHADKLIDTIDKTINQDTIRINIEPKSKEFFTENDYVEVKITANATEPYADKIEGTYRVKVKTRGLSYKIEDSKNSPYMNLILTNALTGENDKKKVELTFDTSKVVLDTTWNEYVKTYTDENYFFNKIVVEINQLESKSIKFYKKDVSEDNSYPNANNTSSAISVNYLL